MPLKRILCCVLLVLFFISLPSYGQGPTASTSHILPHMVDGLFADGSGFVSLLFVTSYANGTVACTYELIGMSIDRLFNAPGQTITGTTASFIIAAAGGIFYTQTLGQDSLASGYSTLNCTGAVTAQLLYVSFGPGEGGGPTLGMATVFPSEAGTYVQFPTIQNGSRLGIGIANDGFDDALCTITVFDVFTGDTVVSNTIVIASKTNRAAFADEFVTIPESLFIGIVILECDNPVSAIGLLFVGQVFTTVPPTVF